MKTAHDIRLNKLYRALNLIPTKYRTLEAKLMPNKWPEYRFLTPMDATRLFHEAYIDAYRDYYRANLDVFAAADIKIGFKLSFHKRNAHLTQLYIARQKADQIGLPYPAYLEFVFKFAAARKRKHPPQPNQLWPTEKKLDAWLTKLVKFWNDDRHCLELNRMKEMPQYAHSAGKELPAQRRYREELIEMVMSGAYSIDSFVAKHVFERHFLPISDCDFLGKYAVKNAERKALADIDIGLLHPSEYGTPRNEDFYQSCFGVPGVIASDNPVCPSCPQRGKCESERQSVISKAISDTGFADPINEADKRKNRRRVKEHRLRALELRSKTHAAPPQVVAV